MRRRILSIIAFLVLALAGNGAAGLLASSPAQAGGEIGNGQP